MNEIEYAFKRGYRFARAWKRLTIKLAMDGEIDPDGWRTSEDGHHYNINTKTGEINAGFGGRLNGQKVGARDQQRFIDDMVRKMNSFQDASKDRVESIGKGLSHEFDFIKGWAKSFPNKAKYFTKEELEKINDNFEKMVVEHDKVLDKLSKKEELDFNDRNYWDHWSSGNNELADAKREFLTSITNAEYDAYTRRFDENKETIAERSGFDLNEYGNMDDVPNDVPSNSPEWGTKPGKYTVFRAGRLNRNVIFTGNNFSSVGAYSDVDVENGERIAVKAYTIDVKKPFVAENIFDSYEKLFDDEIKGELTASKWKSLDLKIAKKAREMGYDVWVMTNPAPPADKEMNIIGNNLLKEIRKTKPTAQKVPKYSRRQLVSEYIDNYEKDKK